MTKRDDYVAKLKSNLDEWNAEMAKWEAQAKHAKADAKKRLDEQIAALQARREEARYQMKLVEGASAEAWKELARGTDQAWKVMQETVARARTFFDKTP
jgi:lipid II:glycine glycyltransferase (peptidoglycan interpeptide bridge formation enzyme)